jgi:tRNA(fMet)-specific endonuclease VapC
MDKKMILCDTNILSKELLKLMKKLNNYNILHFNEKISRLSIQLIEKYNLSHLIIPDAIIAAMALVYDLELFTQNIKDFKYIPNIKLYK